MSELWHRRKEIGEPLNAYHAFTHFRDLPPNARSVDAAHRQHRTHCRNLPANDGVEAPGIWRKWKNSYFWLDRVEAYDVSIDEEARAKRLKDILAMNERHAAIATAVQSKVIARLNDIKPEALSAGQLIIWLRDAAIIERRARGEATDIVRHEGPGAAVDLSALSDDELEQFERLMAKSQQVRAVVGRAEDADE